jgi:hypothetical protein
MAPEQVRADECDGQSDLFSLGAVMYALAVGKPPFRADTLYGMMQRIVHDEPRGIRATNPAIPDWREAFILRLHAKDRRDRFASAAEAAAILEAELIPLQHPGAMAPPPRDWWIRPRQGIFTPCRPLAVAVPGAFLIAQPPVAVPETLPPGAVPAPQSMLGPFATVATPEMAAVQSALQAYKDAKDDATREAVPADVRKHVDKQFADRRLEHDRELADFESRVVDSRQAGGPQAGGPRAATGRVCWRRS